jgi:hypothetical protein
MRLELTKAEARQRALTYLRSQERAAGFELMLLDDCTLERAQLAHCEARP